MKARLIPILIVLALLGFRSTGWCEEPGTGRDRRLLQASEQALDAAGRVAQRPSSGFRVGDPRHEAFWDALERMDRALVEVDRRMARQERAFFQALREGSRSLAALRVAWLYTGVGDPAIDAELDALARSYRALRAGFGAEQRRYQRGGGELSAEERRRFQEIQRTQVRFIALLQPLRARAAERGDRRRVAEIDRLVDRSNEIASADLTLDDYIHASMLDDVLQGEWDAAALSAPSEEREVWREADAVVQELFVEEEAGFVFAVDLGEPPVGEPQVSAEARAPGVVIYNGGGEIPAETLFGSLDELDDLEVDAEIVPIREEEAEAEEQPGEDLEDVEVEEPYEIAEEDLPVEGEPATGTPPVQEKAPEAKPADEAAKAKPAEETPSPAPPIAPDEVDEADEIVEVEDVTWVEATGEEAEGFEGAEPPPGV